MRISQKTTHTRHLMGRHFIGLAFLLLAALTIPLIYRGTASEAAKSNAPIGVTVTPKTPWETGYRSKGNRHKLHVQDARIAQELQARGAQLLADYGSYKLIEVDTASAQSLSAGVQAELRDDNNLIHLNARSLDTSLLDVKLLRGARATGKSAKSTDKAMWLVQFVGPIKPEWYGAMLETGVQVVNYIPNNAYLVFGDAGSLNRLRDWAKQAPVVQWDGDYREEYKVDPQVTAAEAARQKQATSRLARNAAGTASTAQQTGPSYVQVQLVKDPSTNAATLQRVTQLAGSQAIVTQYEIVRFVNLTVQLPQNLTAAAFAKQLSGVGDVIYVAPYTVPRKFDERQDNIIAGNITGNAPSTTNYLNYLGGQGITQTQFDSSNFAVNVVDSGIDNATTNPNHFALHRGGDITAASRVIFNRLEGTPNAGSTLQGCDGHGNLNSHIVAGFVPTGNLGGVNFGAAPHADASGFRYGLGVAPFVKVGSTVIFDPNSYTFPSFPSIESKAYNDGARISTNSWGASTGGAYTADSQAYDFLVRDAQPTGAPFTAAGNQEMVIVFAAGNDGSGPNTVGSPGTAKNVITAGASENVHPFGGADACGTGDVEADNLNDVVGFSSRGPCDDGRVKPDLMAPGSHVSGGVFQQNAVATGTGLAGSCFNAGGVCAGPGGSNFWPLSQQFYTASSGTSHSTPAIAGAAALVRQRFLNASLNAPSPAMTKAVLMNSARYMNGTGANDNRFSNNQGMGLVNLNGFFDVFSTPGVMRDQAAADTFTSSGQQRTITGVISDPTKPFRVSLAWTDAPGATSGNAFVNNLDLEVVVNGQLYKGNVFSGQFSTTGGSADGADNTESVILPAGTTGTFVVTVKATNIAGDGVPNSGGALDQDYALVIYNGTQANVPVISSTVAITAEDCALDGRTDPGEGITVNVCLSNVGTANTGNVTVSLQASGGVTSPSSTQTFGVLAANGATVCKTFTFRVNSNLTCGTNVTATFSVQDGNNAPTTFTQVYGSGSAVIALAQGFDGVTAPSLPSGWLATNVVGGSPLWVTSATTPNSVPNAAFVDDPAALSDKVLETPAVNFTSTAGALSFRNNYNLESTFDGGVLEISVNGGAYVDVTTLAGASFTSGGYNGTVDTGFSNPLAGRSAWTGNAGGYVLSRVALGSSLVGKSAKFRFRMGSDTSVAGTGWRVDDVQVENGFACCVSVTPVVRLTDPAACTGPGNNVAGSVALTNPTGTALTGGTVTVALPAGLVGTDGCTSNFGTCVVSPTAITWTGTVPGNSTLNISYLAQVGDVQAGTQLCVLTSGSFAGSGVVPVQTCLTVNCQAPGPGGIIPSVPPGGFGASPPSDQKPGSILIYPVYTSGSDSSKQNTRISLTNVSPGQSAFVHLYFVDGSTCSVADAFICLTPNQTTTFLASDLDPGTTGYLVAMAVNREGCPINFNYLVGDEYAKFSSGHAGGLGAVSVPAVPGSFTVCGSQASVQFDGVNYAPLPRTVALDNVASRADGNSTLLVLNRVGGDLLTTASVLTNLFGNLYNDAEVGLSFSLRPNTCQYRALVDNNFPRSTPRFEQFIPAGRSGWFKISSTDDIAIVGAAFTLNTNSSASANAFNGGHNLHTLTTTTSARYIVPVLPVSCQ